MVGWPLGSTTRGGHHGVESLALSLIAPPNFGGGAGSCFPSTVVVALGEPGTPVACCAATDVTASMAASKNTANAATIALCTVLFIIFVRLLFLLRIVLDGFNFPPHFPPPGPRPTSRI